MNLPDSNKIRNNLALLLCLFLIIAPFLGSYVKFDDERSVIIWGTYFPYIHLSITQIGGMPFADSFAALGALIISAIGVIGFLMFLITGFKNKNGLVVFLHLTIGYCICRAGGGLFFNILFGNFIPSLFLCSAIVSDLFWALLCWQASKVLRKKIDVFVEKPEEK